VSPPQDSHIEHVAESGGVRLDVALASTSSTVVIVRGYTSRPATILLLACPSSGMAAMSAAEVRAADSGNAFDDLASSVKRGVAWTMAEIAASILTSSTAIV